MTEHPPEKFHLLDAIVFVAATALAAAATRHWWVSSWENFRPGGDAYLQDFPTFLYQVRYLVYEASYFTAAWTLSCLALGARRPRARSRPLLDQPGLVACLAATVVLGLRLATFAPSLALHYWHGVRYFASEFTMLELIDWEVGLTQVPSEVGCAVVAAWVIRRAGGHRRSEASSLDRLGRILGWLWIATIPFSPFSWTT